MHHFGAAVAPPLSSLLQLNLLPHTWWELQSAGAHHHRTGGMENSPFVPSYDDASIKADRRGGCLRR